MSEISSKRITRTSTVTQTLFKQKMEKQSERRADNTHTQLSWASSLSTKLHSRSATRIYSVSKRASSHVPKLRMHRSRTELWRRDIPIRVYLYCIYAPFCIYCTATANILYSRSDGLINCHGKKPLIVLRNVLNLYFFHLYDFTYNFLASLTPTSPPLRKK